MILIPEIKNILSIYSHSYVFFFSKKKIILEKFVIYVEKNLYIYIIRCFDSFM